MSEPSTQPKKDRLASLRHDLRTPINQIIGYSEMVGEELVDLGEDGLNEDLHKVSRAARTLLDLIQEELQPERYQYVGSDNVNPVASSSPSSDPSAPEKKRFPNKETDGSDQKVPLQGHILVVDDNPENRDMLERRLEREGLSVRSAENGQMALDQVEEHSFDVILLDIMMPGMDGREVLRRLKENEATRHIPVIMISALDELESVVYCIERGAEDFLPKPFNPTLLRARLDASLQKKHFRDQEQKYLQALQSTQDALQSELNEAADYVTALLPPEEESPIGIQWKFVPSTSLGGDSFGYHWIDDDHFAFYLVDVCGHGVGAALLSISAINVLRSQTLPNTDFRSPASVLSGLNETFPMERQNNMYFTMWYGVFHRKTRSMKYSSGGHPPALLYDQATKAMTPLRTPGLVIGCMEGATFPEASTKIPNGGKLYVFSDGVYEITREDESLVTLEEYSNSLIEDMEKPGKLVDESFLRAQALNRSDILDDDFSLMEIIFDAEVNS